MSGCTVVNKEQRSRGTRTAKWKDATVAAGKGTSSEDTFQRLPSNTNDGIRADTVRLLSVSQHSAAVNAKSDYLTAFRMRYYNNIAPWSLLQHGDGRSGGHESCTLIGEPVGNASWV